METETLATPDSANISDISEIKRKTHFSGSVLKTTLAGAIVDIGLDTPGVVHISQLQKEPVNRVEDVVKIGQTVDVWIRRVDPTKHRIELTMIKPLDLEWREIAKDMVVKGKVARLEKFGVFVDIGAERPGLVHISEMTHGYIRNPGDVVKEGDEVEVKVLGVNRRKKQIKLSMKALEEKPVKPARPGKEKETSTPPPAAEAPAASEEAVPTAMELAMREAMQRARTREDEETPRGRRKPGGNRTMEDILNRTLQQKAKTSK
jgi:small subunit ribosomal protein S1